MLFHHYLDHHHDHHHHDHDDDDDDDYIIVVSYCHHQHHHHHHHHLHHDDTFPLSARAGLQFLKCDMTAWSVKGDRACSDPAVLSLKRDLHCSQLPQVCHDILPGPVRQVSDVTGTGKIEAEN